MPSRTEPRAQWPRRAAWRPAADNRGATGSRRPRNPAAPRGRANPAPRPRREGSCRLWIPGKVFGSEVRYGSLRSRVQAPSKNALLRMQAVLGLIEHDGMRPVHDVVGHLLAAMG